MSHTAEFINSNAVTSSHTAESVNLYDETLLLCKGEIIDDDIESYILIRDWNGCKY